MKIYNKYLLISFLSLGLTSCEKWLDVAPKTQIEADKVFEKEVGFQDALTGVYVKMTNESLYGRELTFGMVDGLGGVFTNLYSPNQYFSTLSYDFQEDNFKSKSNAIFEDSYNVIANINTLLENVEKKGPNFFTGVNYDIIKGEAYGLRAFLHFDLIRLFGSSILSKGTTDSYLPYVDEVGITPKERLTTKAFLDRVISDLEIAASTLKKVDPIIPVHANNATTYLRDRTFKFNYYAVKALQARVLLYAGDKNGALAAAKEVIDSNVFQWTPSTEIATYSESLRNKVFTQELIFNLNVSNLSEITSPFFDVGVSGSLLSKYPYEYTNFFQTADYRFQYLTVEVSSLYKRYSNKLVQTGGASSAYANRMPLIRKSELYYIAAECLLDTDINQAVSYLNAVRQRRNLADVSASSGISSIENEIKLEYRREFIGEGQLFYYFKRKNLESVDGVYKVMNESTYVLPLPEREVSYGK